MSQPSGTDQTPAPARRTPEAAFEIAAHHGCLVVRDTESEGDLAGWDPAGQPWFVDGGSAIFGVLPGVDGVVRCEVWRDAPDDEVSHELFKADLDVSGALRVEDPAGLVTIDLPMARGKRTLRVLVDDLEWPTHVQVVVS